MYLIDSVNSSPPGQMAAVSQTTFSNAFSCMKMHELGLKFHWIFYSAPSHYLNQCCLDSVTLVYGTKGIWVNITYNSEMIHLLSTKSNAFKHMETSLFTSPYLRKIFIKNRNFSDVFADINVFPCIAKNCSINPIRETPIVHQGFQIMFIWQRLF